MESLRGIRKAIAIYTPLILIALIGELDSHELRPSYHGLDYQSSAAGAGQESASGMRSFFGGSSSPTSTSSSVAMPKAMNSNSTNNDRSWWGGDTARGRDHVREVLLVATVACGITGVVLLVVSTLICVLKSRRQRSLPVPPPTSAEASSCHDTENKLQIVVRDS
ncbi:hypothetical protein I3843_10G104100 [Carya illinoinensis]|uniref:Uncharacterized protein n=1 Tax=Carya illinoinensis TaxID=32201 RepID=A0A8T1PA67_CARIL|nr:uncharacterized protein LOC122279614 [Carya illinoinensis]KAG2685052.1 hypothetical protein I3760_10G106600 [Carya illinoinensis]KAG6639555.1 hypothetical protein CIPAW_10G109100 [Carya illinoinensis]KAG6692300.1 hypothetical protein I3842_10G108500 [Carya illinoinensis]KAG7960081.1 hypothetical protein I3843_10G104100 [Carya illinoinensis]